MKNINNLKIHGFTINPVTHPDILKNIIRGLASYSDMHKCDFLEENKPRKIHKNNLGKLLNISDVIEIKKEGFSGLIGHCILENGYFNLRIWNDVYPSEIHFNLFLEDDILDADLIIDHLSAPAVPNDGTGMFDYTYSINKEILTSNPLQKFSKSESSYYVNDPIRLNGEEWEVTLNKLGQTTCHFCESTPHYWLFVKNEENYHSRSSAVIVCKDHMKMGRTTELGNANPDFIFVNPINQTNETYNSKNMKKFKMHSSLNKENNTTITENLSE